MKIADDPNHPKLIGVKTALLKDPTLTKNFVANCFGLSTGTLLAWEKKGWVKFKKADKSKWGKHKGPVIPYDLNMKKVKK